MLDIDKEYYVVECYDFVYFPRIVHITGIVGSACNSELEYYVNLTDELHKDRRLYEKDLTRFKTFEEAEDEAKRLNDIPENKKRAEQWNSKDKFICKMMEQL